MTNSIDLVIPTMWCDDKFVFYLEQYCEFDSIQKIYIIDNDHTSRPQTKILDHPKISIIWYGRNIYVNPAWNEGYYRSQADVMCLLNDDVFVEETVFQFMQHLDFSNIDLIGVHLKGSIDNYHIVEHPDRQEELIKLEVDKSQPIGGQSYAFGVCMFVKRSSYKVIPSLYQIWYGDDYLIQRSQNIYTLKTSCIHGEISKTIVNHERSTDIKQRIKLDGKNVFRFNHFMNGRNWDIIRKKL